MDYQTNRIVSMNRMEYRKYIIVSEEQRVILRHLILRQRHVITSILV